ncbi:hypothetical protein HPB52_008575 [Rhipicephalus sanguineus]|uniref:THAP-type domain-containing protein n=1 Tax=Rhipicephalus sanguineus TaxID=34632 RepID=A0A9D4PYV7_RHISA|nr:hypothetical protein HPB52_008575 [Rhipicephalus sanguineus]
MTTNISGNLRYNSKLYKDNNELQRGINLKAMDFLHMTFAPDDNTENQQFLDIGCGTGDFTRDWLLPRCSPCRRLVAVDASEDMLSYARTNSSHPKIQYDYLNIGDDVTDFLGKYRTFDRIYSFFCLNWLKDQAEAMRNVSRLLTPSGECLLLFPAWSPTRTLWKEVAQLDRWKKFSNDLEDDKARLSYLRNTLDSAGLAANTCELLYVKIDFSESIQTAVDINLSVNPVLALLSPEEEELFRKDVTNKIFNGFMPKSQDLEDDKTTLSYLRNILDSAGLLANTYIQLSVNPVVASLSPEENELLRKDVTNEVMRPPQGIGSSAEPDSRCAEAKPRGLKIEVITWRNEQRHCCVPGCRGDSDGEKAMRVFAFSADADRRRQWLKAIPRADFVPGNTQW